MTIAIDEYKKRVIRACSALFPGSLKYVKKGFEREVKPLLDEFGTNYPNDVLDIGLALRAVRPYCATDYLVLPRVEDIKFIKDLIPDCCRDIQVKITPEIKIYGTRSKYGSSYWEVNYKDLLFPFSLTARCYTDMDDESSHSEAEVEKEDTFYVKEKNPEEDLDVLKEKLRKFLESIIGI